MANERSKLEKRVYSHWRTGKYTLQQIADKLGTSLTKVSNIITRRLKREKK